MAETKKQLKTEAKLAKKRAKTELKRQKADGAAPPESRRPSPAVVYAEAVRGVLSVLTGVSILAALALGQRGTIIALDDIIDGLFLARTGKVVLALIGAALLIYGMKYLRIVR